MNDNNDKNQLSNFNINNYTNDSFLTNYSHESTPLSQTNSLSIKPRYSFLKLKVCSFNTNGAKRNLNFLQHLFNDNDIIFLCETWFLDHESDNFLNSLSSLRLTFHNSDMSILPIRGRPYGGRAFIIKKNLTIVNKDFINKHISFLTISKCSEFFTFTCVYMPFDNNSPLNFSEYKSCLQIVGELYHFYTIKKYNIFLLGDWNADITRGNRFDDLFTSFISNNNLCCISPSTAADLFSYSNGSYKAKLDHCLISNRRFEIFNNCTYYENNINLSDQKPILITINLIHDSNNKYKDNCNNQLQCNDQEIKLITLIPNLENEEINRNFKKILAQQMNQFNNIEINNPENKQKTINEMYLQLTNSIKFAYTSCSRTTTLSILSKKKWFTNELKRLKEKILLIRHTPNQSQEELNELRNLRKDFKKIMKKNIL